MKISLLKLVREPRERDPNIPGSEARKFLKFLLDENGWGISHKAWQQVFSEYNKKAQEDFIREMHDEGWVTEEMVDQLDVELRLTEKVDVLPMAEARGFLGHFRTPAIHARIGECLVQH